MIWTWWDAACLAMRAEHEVRNVFNSGDQAAWTAVIAAVVAAGLPIVGTGLATWQAISAQEVKIVMDSGDAAAWTAAIVAIAAASVSLVGTGVAIWQAISARSQSKSAKLSAEIAQKALTVSERAAGAAQRQAAEARRQNEIAEEQLQLAREELAAQQHRQQQDQADKHVTAVYAVLRAAEELHDEIPRYAGAAFELQDSSSSHYPVQADLSSRVLYSRARNSWDAAVDTLRVDKPAPAVMEAIKRFDSFVTNITDAIETAHDRAGQHQLVEEDMLALAAAVSDGDEDFETLTQACESFFAANGGDPRDLAPG